MRPSQALTDATRAEIRRVVDQHRGANPRIFGSVARGCDQEGSDLDLVITGRDGITLFDIGAISIALESLLGVRVEVYLDTEIPKDQRKSILASSRPV